jgi:hypothetical protein
MQLLFLGVVGTLVGVVGLFVRTAAVTALTSSNASAYSYTLISGIFAGSGNVYAIVSVIIGFFIVVGIQYLLAKAFGGVGTFVQHGYDYLLYYVPIGAVSALLGLIPVVGAIAGFGLGIYGIVLNVFAVQAAHRLSGGKAVAVVLIPVAAIILLVGLCVVIAVTLLFAAANGSSSY